MIIFIGSLLFKSKMFEYTDTKRPGAIARPPSAKTIETRSKSYSEISNKNHLKSTHALADQQEAAYADGYYAFGWGRNRFNELPSVWPSAVIDAACGEKHTIFLNSKFQVYVCGDNQYGQLGLPAQNCSSAATPMQVMKERGVSNIFCGPYSTFLVTSKGEVFGMGLNSRGQLGTGSDSDQKTGPVLIESLSLSKKPHRQSSRGRITTTVPANCGNILTQRQPSRENIMKDHTPEKKYKFFEVDEQRKVIPSTVGENYDFVKQITCGPFHTLVLTTKGRLLASGLKLTGDLSSEQYSTEFSQVKFRTPGNYCVQQISSGLTMNAALTSEGRVYIWGVFQDTVINEPTSLELRNIIEVCLGGEYNCLLTAKGEVYQLYNDQTDTQLKPKKVEGLPHVRSIKSGGDFALAVATQSKQVYAWGKNKYGQVIPEKPSTNIILSPSIVKNSEIFKVFCGSYHCVALAKKFTEDPGQRIATTMSSRPRELLEEYRQQSEEAKAKKKDKKSVKIQTQPMQKFEGTTNVNARTFSTTLQIPFSELTLEKQVSEGGYGIIYKGKWRQTTVAIKVFKIDSAQSSVKDFLSECHAMQALRHPNIVMFLGACTKPPHFAIVLEYCSKGTLWSILQSNIDLSWEDRRRFALDTARGMNYLHSCEVPILHRDLKSLNLLLDESYRVKLADFGWTKGLENYMTGKIGTYQWMAPEVISGQKYTQKADVFSFGIILWQIASRQPPYRNVSGIQVSIEVANNDLRPPIPKRTPEAFTKLMRRCWDRNPQARPSFKEAIRELETMKLS